MSSKTHYDVLEVTPAAAADEIKRAFRAQIARYHPDKVQHLGKEFQEMAAVRAAELTEAYRVLSNESQVGVARSGYFPQINALAGTELRSSPLTDNIREARAGYIFGATGTWAKAMGCWCSIPRPFPSPAGVGGCGPSVVWSPGQSR